MADKKPTIETESFDVSFDGANDSKLVLKIKDDDKCGLTDIAKILLNLLLNQIDLSKVLNVQKIQVTSNDKKDLQVIDVSEAGGFRNVLNSLRDIRDQKI